jgi:hypothetical protein
MAFVMWGGGGGACLSLHSTGSILMTTFPSPYFSSSAIFCVVWHTWEAVNFYYEQSKQQCNASVTDDTRIHEPNAYIHVHIWERFMYIFQYQSAYFAAAKYVDGSWEEINRSQTHECRNWERGRAISFLEVHGIFVAVCIVQYKAGLFGRRIQWCCRVKGSAFKSSPGSSKLCWLRDRMGWLAGKPLCVVQDRKWRTMCVPLLLRQRARRISRGNFIGKNAK